MHVVAILQARVSSTRLPKKVLMPILGEPMLAHQVRRVLESSQINQLVVATSTECEDDPIDLLCRELQVDCYRGNLNDVLDRYYRAALCVRADHIVRLTGDCPLADSKVIDSVILQHVRLGVDYTSNIWPPTFPDGLDVEVMSLSALERSWRDAGLTSEREHVTLHIRNNENTFVCSNIENECDLSSMRWTVDEMSDFEFVTEIYKRLYRDYPNFDMNDVLDALVKEPELTLINAMISRNEGLAQILRNDSVFSEKGVGYEK